MPGIFDQIQMLGMKDCRVILKLEVVLSFFRKDLLFLLRQVE